MDNSIFAVIDKKLRVIKKDLDSGCLYLFDTHEEAYRARKLLSKANQQETEVVKREVSFSK